MSTSSSISVRSTFFFYLTLAGQATVMPCQLQPVQPAMLACACAPTLQYVALPTPLQHAALIPIKDPPYNMQYSTGILILPSFGSGSTGTESTVLHWAWCRLRAYTTSRLPEFHFIIIPVLIVMVARRCVGRDSVCVAAAHRVRYKPGFRQAPAVLRAGTDADARLQLCLIRGSGHLHREQ
jgi:hypothetical protein